MKSQGQTTVEYMLILVVVVGLAITFMKQVQTFVIGEADNCRPNSQSLICRFESTYNFGNLRYYPLQI